MGLDFSRGITLPDDIDDSEVRNELMRSLNSDVIMNYKLNTKQKDMASMLPDDVLISAGKFMVEYFETKTPESLKLLEIMAGNRVASDILYSQLKLPVWITTDICSFESKSDLPFHQLDAVTAVSKFGADSNILLLVCPLPASASNHNEQCWAYADYYACHDFINQKSDICDRYIVFIGELGASDGSEGMYSYLNEHEKLLLDSRELLVSGIDMFGAPIEKELFIYKLIKN